MLAVPLRSKPSDSVSAQSSIQGSRFYDYTEQRDAVHALPNPGPNQSLRPAQAAALGVTKMRSVESPCTTQPPFTVLRMYPTIREGSLRSDDTATRSGSEVPHKPRFPSSILLS